MNIEHLSFSSISNYLICPKSWKYKYLDRIPTKTSPALLFGSAWHGLVESIVTGNVDPARKRDHFKADFEERVSQAEANGGIEWGNETPATMINMAYRWLASSEIKNGIETVKVLRDENGPAIERKITVNVPGVPVPVIGYIDVITEDGVCGDFKTSAKSWSDKQASDSLQPLFYLAGLRQEGIPVEMKFRHYVFVKTKEPKFQMIETRYDPMRLLFLFGLIKNVWDAMDRGAYFENPGSWKCAEGNCEFWKICRGRFQ